MNTVVELDIQLLAFLAGTVIPLLVAVLTKLRSSSQVKAVANLVLSILAGAVAYALEHNGRFTWYEMLTAMATTYLASGVTFHNLWEPTAVAPRLRTATAEIGVGRPVTGPHV